MSEWGYFLFYCMDYHTVDICPLKHSALCGAQIDYVAVQSYNVYTGEPITVVLAKALLNTHFNRKRLK